jgi:toxin ParE1/3/4
MTHRLTARASSDLAEFWSDVAERSRNVAIADLVVRSIVDRFLLLADQPYLGRKRDTNLYAGMRSFPIGQYAIFYRIAGEDVVILRMVHGSRGLRSLYQR